MTENDKAFDFSRGYFCAVAVLLRYEGCASTEVRELFSSGNIKNGVDAIDLELFVEHSLVTERQAQEAKQGEQANG